MVSAIETLLKDRHELRLHYNNMVPTLELGRPYYQECELTSDLVMDISTLLY